MTLKCDTAIEQEGKARRGAFYPRYSICFCFVSIVSLTVSEEEVRVKPTLESVDEDIRGEMFNVLIRLDL